MENNLDYFCTRFSIRDEIERLNKCLNDGLVPFSESIFRNFQNFLKIKYSENDSLRKLQETYGKMIISPEKMKEVDAIMHEIEKVFSNDF